jgi:hypothetical protein
VAPHEEQERAESILLPEQLVWSTMRSTFSRRPGSVIRGSAFCVLLAFHLSVMAGTPAERLDMVVTPAGTFSNVSVVSMTETHVTLKGSDGSVATLKLTDLDATTLARLRGETPVTTQTPGNASEKGTLLTSLLPNSDGTNTTSTLVDRSRSAVEEFLQRMSPEQAGMAFVGIVLGIALLFYLFQCYCMRLICKKTGNDPGFLIWLPVLQVFPMLRAASMSYWWFLGLLIPVLNIVTSVLWCIKITQARGKHWIVALLLILPFTNLFAFLYLAFSSGVEVEPETPSVPQAI